MKQPILADLHNHLHEKNIEPKDWWNAAKKRKLAVIAITEHYCYRPKEAYLRLKAIQPKGIILIPGVEAKTSVGDLLVYGTDEKVYSSKELLKEGIDVEKALEIVKKNNLVASFAHPYGFKTDSIAEVMGEEQARKLVDKYRVGAEYYNGLLGSANQLLFGKKIPRKFYSLLDFFDKNRVTSRLRINKPTNWTKRKLDTLAVEMLERVRKGMIFAQSSAYFTAGSDAHYPTAMGCGVLELKKRPKSEKEFLKMLTKREIIWAGPNIYSDKPVDSVGRKEIIEGIKYWTKTKVFKKKKKKLPRRKRLKKWLSKRIKRKK